MFSTITNQRVAVLVWAILFGTGCTKGVDEPNAAPYQYEAVEQAIISTSGPIELVPDDVPLPDPFGYNVDVDGDWAIVGELNNDELGESVGAAYIFERNRTGLDGWGQVIKLFPSEYQAWDRFGCDVSISGDTAVVGTCAADAGIFVFSRNHGGQDNWGEIAKIDRLGYFTDKFGSSLAISGDTIVVGSPGATLAHKGNVWVFERNASGAEKWGNVASIDCWGSDEYMCGRDVDISGSAIIIASEEYLPMGQGDAGKAYIFERNVGGPDAWGLKKMLQRPGGNVFQDSWFGETVALKNDTAVVTMTWHRNWDAETYAACLFRRDEGGANNWGRVKTLATTGAPVSAAAEDEVVIVRFGLGLNIYERNEGGADNWGLRHFLEKPAGVSGFGSELAMSQDTIVAGTDGDGIFAYTHNGTPLTKVAKSSGDLASRAGTGVSLYGSHAALGLIEQREVRILERNEGGQDGWGHSAVKTPFAPDATDQFGYSVSITSVSLAVGAPGAINGAMASGLVYLYGRNFGSANAWDSIVSISSPTPENEGRFGDELALSADLLIVGAPGQDNGAAYLYERNTTGENQWGLLQAILPNDLSSDARFGDSVALDGGVAVVGAPNADNAGVYSGSVYIFERNTGGMEQWSQIAKITAPDGEDASLFGKSVAYHEPFLVVGAPGKNDIGEDSGAAYVFERNQSGADTWGLVAKVAPELLAAGDRFGHSVSLNVDTVAVGAPGDGENTNKPGRVHLFERNTSGFEVWGETQRFSSPDSADDDEFGFDVALGEGFVVVGAPGSPEFGADAGAALVFSYNDDTVRQQGQACSWHEQCSTGFCVDGVCCDTACNDGDRGDCAACSLQTGASSNGTCENLGGAVICRESMGVCDPAEYCDGLNTACPVDSLSTSDTVCRAAAGTCDTPEHCTGFSLDCPHDAYAPLGTECRASQGLCDTPELCAGDDIACPTDQRMPAATVCRAAAGDCDETEYCNGFSVFCGSDQFKAGGTVCRSIVGPCDLEENCSGVDASCPADTVRPSTFECRGSIGVCDPPELCDGSGVLCPSDTKSITTCRAALGPCDLAEACDGIHDDCPADMKSNALCRNSGGVCDLPEYCDGINDACPSDQKSSAMCRDATGACDLAEHCDGMSNNCPTDVKSTQECRPSLGACDVADHCDGLNDECPLDLKSSDFCRASGGPCDPAEVCDGLNDDCPADLKSNTLCRDSGGVCDVPEYCDGINDACPSDQKTIDLCRVATGPCDLPEYCDGVSLTCPSDSKSTQECRPSLGACDIAEHCDGTNDGCPLDSKSSDVCRASDGPCDPAEICDGQNNSCPVDMYDANNVICDDQDPFTADDRCNFYGECVGEPIVGLCQDPIVIDFLPFSERITTSLTPSANFSFGPGCVSTDPLASDVVFKVEVYAGETITVSALPFDGYDLALHIVDTCDQSVDCIASEDDGYGGDPESATIVVDNDRTIYILVTSTNAAETGDYQLDIESKPAEQDTSSDSESDEAIDSDTATSLLSDSDSMSVIDTDSKTEESIDSDSGTASTDAFAEVEDSATSLGGDSCGCGTVGWSGFRRPSLLHILATLALVLDDSMAR